MDSCLKSTGLPCVVGTRTESFFCVQQDGTSCPTPIMQVSVVTSVLCAQTVTLFTANAAGAYTVPYAGSVARRVACPQKVEVCNVAAPVANLQIEFGETLMYSASTEQALMRIRQYDETTGLWALRYENLNGTAFVGALPADLTVQSAQVNVTRTKTLGCAQGVPYTMRETTRFDAETGALESEVVEYIDSLSVLTTFAPVGFVLGPCVAPAPGPTTGGALPFIAGAVRSLQPEFLGLFDGTDTSSVVGNLLSVTVSARGVTDGPNSANTVVVQCPDGTNFNMMDGQTFTWSVARDQDSALRREYLFFARGEAYANIGYTFV